MAVVLFTAVSCKIFTKADPMVATPTFDPPSGAYEYGQAISIYCSTPQSTILYSIDGSEPNLIYTQPIMLRHASIRLRAVATRPQWSDSKESYADYNLGRLPRPLFSIAPGTYHNPQILELDCDFDGVTIHYTTDQTEPTQDSATYESPIEIDSSTTVLARAFKEGWMHSDNAGAHYSITMSSINIDPASGVYNTAPIVSLSCVTNGADIRYTTDGSIPTERSPLYKSPFAVSANGIVMAKGFKEGWEPGPTALASYTIEIQSPTFDPPGAYYQSTQSISISTISEGASIYYTTDGSEPNQSSLIYEQPIVISSSTMIKARAIKEGCISSLSTTERYVLAIDTPPDMICVVGGTFNNGSSDISLSTFYIGRFEVSQIKYYQVTGLMPSGFYGYSDRPVEQVSWFAAIAYCNLASIEEELTPCYSYHNYGTNPDEWPAGWDSDASNHNLVACNWSANGYRLPTEMEWMFAAKGGNLSQGYIYSGSSVVDYVGWYRWNSSHRTHTLGTKQSNELGVYDMSGNVFEWCWDRWWTYPSEPQTDPTGSNIGSTRSFRGGCWDSDNPACRVTQRNNVLPTYSQNTLGVRVCRSVNHGF